MPDYVEPEYPVENKEDSDSDDYIEKLLKEIRDQGDYNEEPSKEITPKVKPQWQGNTYFIYFHLKSIQVSRLVFRNFVFIFFCFVFCSKQKSGRWFLSTKF